MCTARFYLSRLRFRRTVPIDKASMRCLRYRVTHALRSAYVDAALHLAEMRSPPPSIRYRAIERWRFRQRGRLSASRFLAFENQTR